MRRIIYSIILGFVVPVAGIAVLAILEDYFPKNMTDATFYEQSAPGILFAPFTLPIYFDIFAKEERLLPFVFDTVWFRVSSFILFDWALYGLLTYFVLGRFKRFKKREIVFSDAPPSPPEFEG